MSLITLDLNKKLFSKIKRLANDSNQSIEAVIHKFLEENIYLGEELKHEKIQHYLKDIENLLKQIPTINTVTSGINPRGDWSVRFFINIQHKLAWNVIQELGFILNGISLSEKLPTVFMPVSPPPYLNGGPEEYLSWVIESKTKNVNPRMICEILQERLPNPLSDEDQWIMDS